MFSWPRSSSLPGKTGRRLFLGPSNLMVKWFDKYLANIQCYFAKSLAKFSATFTKTSWNLCQIFNKNLIQQLISQYNSGNVGRMIYFRENSNVTVQNLPRFVLMEIKSVCFISDHRQFALNNLAILFFYETGRRIGAVLRTCGRQRKIIIKWKNRDMQTNNV